MGWCLPQLTHPIERERRREERGRSHNGIQFDENEPVLKKKGINRNRAVC